MNHVPENILERIRKLLAKADPTKNDSQAEIETAMKMAQKLALEYELDLEKIQVQEKRIREIFTKIISADTLAVKNEGSWLQSLITVLGKHNYCVVHFMKRGSKVMSLRIYGEDHNIEMTGFMFDQLVPRIRTLAKQSYKTYEGFETKNTYIRGFLHGCVIGLNTMLDKLRKEEEAANNKVTALILVKENAVNTYLEENSLVAKGTHNSRKLQGGDGQWDGYVEGKNMTLQKGLNA